MSTFTRNAGGSNTRASGTAPGRGERTVSGRRAPSNGTMRATGLSRSSPVSVRPPRTAVKGDRKGRRLGSAGGCREES